LKKTVYIFILSNNLFFIWT